MQGKIVSVQLETSQWGVKHQDLPGRMQTFFPTTSICCITNIYLRFVLQEGLTFLAVERLVPKVPIFVTTRAHAQIERNLQELVAKGNTWALLCSNGDE